MKFIKDHSVELIGVLTAFVVTWGMGCGNIADVFVFAAAYMSIYYLEKHDKKIDAPSAIVAVIFSGAYMVAEVCRDDSSIRSLYNGKLTAVTTCLRLIGLAVTFYVCLRLLLLVIDERTGDAVRDKIEHGRYKHFQLYCFGSILLCWLPWAIFNYPGSFCPDAQWQVRQALGDTGMTGHHPPLSTFIMGALLKFGDFIWDKNFGCFLYLLLQACFGAWVFAFGLNKLYVHGLRIEYCALGSVFLAITPFWGCFVQWYEKDLLYAEATTLFLICLIELIMKKSCSARDAFELMAAGILASLLRNNGIYAVIPAVLMLAVCAEKKYRKILWLSLAATVIIYCGITKGLYTRVLGIENGSVKEALSIPFQQTARYVKYHGDEVTEEEKETIDAVLDYNALAEKYNSHVSDAVKETYKGDNSKLPEYFKVWFKMFWKHPKTYVAAALYGAYGYIAPVETNIEPPVSPINDFYSYLTGIGVHGVSNAWLVKQLNRLRSYNMSLPLIRYLCMPGMYTWCVIVCAIILCRYKQFRALIMLIPQAMNILVCVASPLPNAIRYELPVAAAFPFMIGWTCYFVSKSKNEATSG